MFKRYDFPLYPLKFIHALMIEKKILKFQEKAQIYPQQNFEYTSKVLGDLSLRQSFNKMKSDEIFKGLCRVRVQNILIIQGVASC